MKVAYLLSCETAPPSPDTDQAADQCGAQKGRRTGQAWASPDSPELEGIAKAKAAGVYRGRKPSIDQAQVEKLRAEGLGADEIAKRLNIGRASVYRVLAS